MRLFGRDEETLNEKLLREAGLDRPHAPLPAPQPIPAMQQAPTPFAYDDTLVVANAPGIAGGQVVFVALPGGDLIVESEQGDADLSPLADATERNIEPPYRATCTRQQRDLWGIVAKRLDVRELSCDAGDEIEITGLGGETTVTVDGQPSELRFPQLEQSGDYAVHASRIDGDFWEVGAHPL